MAAPLHFISTPAGAQLALDPLALLRALPGPVAFRVAGQDRTRCRGLVTLLHGNEPSGFVGLMRWLRAGAVPAVDVLCVIGAVEAARAGDGFACRMLPGQRDLNRCFDPTDGGDDPQARLAAAIRAALADARCEAVADLHNNTGPNPSYGVVPTVDGARRRIVAQFTRRCIVTHVRLGALFEHTDAPCAAIECGQTGDPRADDVAFEGIARYAGAPGLPADADADAEVDVDAYEASERVTIVPGVRIAFATAPVPAADVTFVPAIERYNFTQVPAGASLGWSSGPWPLRVGNGDGRDLFEVVNRELRARRPLMPAMITADPAAVVQDCLCYLLRPRGHCAS